MNELTLSITDLKSKVEKLVNLHQQVKKDNELLQLDNQHLKKTIDEQKITIETLEKNNKELIQNKEEEQTKIVADTKQRINELVQEIDNCITLLK
jgi:multidrug resistance efflux pump